MKTGLLLTNTGTPDAPEAASVRRYLREFLSDKRIVQIPRLFWYPILYGLILPFRPRRSASLYQRIWHPDGSPMRVSMLQLKQKLSQHLGQEIIIALGMNYGQPSIADGIRTLLDAGVDRLLILPLFPQYSTTSTGSSLDRVTPLAASLDLDHTPLRVIKSYATHPAYIQALAHSVRNYWNTNGRGEHLLISFHGIPERLVQNGDPYQHECDLTSRALAQSLGLEAHQWTLCYQSQFGYDKWLKPSTQEQLLTMPKQNIKHLDIICPGFAIDCLETLEEIALTGQEAFKEAGGHTLNYIPALNDTDSHVDMLSELISEHMATKPLLSGLLHKSENAPA